MRTKERITKKEGFNMGERGADMLAAGHKQVHDNAEYNM